MSTQIGVTGHRQPPKLPTEAVAPLRQQLDALFAALARADRNQGVVVSALAEGADRLVAEAGLAAGWKLKAILPFSPAEYEKDFATPSSRAAFRRLVARAATVVELPGRGGNRPPAYAAAGLAMLDDLALLIAIWDGRPAAGKGGSADIVAAALERRIPVAWLDPAAPAEFRLSGGAGRPAAGLPDSFHPATPAEIARRLEAR